jgi:hypothetical protein
MRRVIVAAAGLCLAFTPIAAKAQTAAPAAAPAPVVTMLTTATLANLCSVSGDQGDVAIAMGYCRGFIIAVGQYHFEISRPGGRPAIFCLPDPAPTLEAAQTAFVAWAAANPQYGAERAVDGLLRWAASAYPCRPAARPASR